MLQGEKEEQKDSEVQGRNTCRCWHSPSSPKAHSFAEMVVASTSHAGTSSPPPGPTPAVPGEVQDICSRQGGHHRPTTQESPRPQGRPAAVRHQSTCLLQTLEHLHPLKSKGSAPFQLQRALCSPITSTVTHRPCFMAFREGAKAPCLSLGFYSRCSFSEAPRRRTKRCREFCSPADESLPGPPRKAVDPAHRLPCFSKRY